MNKIKRKIRGTPPRGKYTVARRFFQLAILTLFSIQVLLHGRLIMGSLASSKVLLGLALLPLTAYGLYHLFVGTKGLERKTIGLTGFSLVTISLIIAFYQLFAGIPFGYNDYTYASVTLFVIGSSLVLTELWSSNRDVSMLHFVLVTAPIFFAMAIAFAYLTSETLVLTGAAALTSAALAIATYSHYVHIKRKVLKDFAVTFAVASIGFAIITTAAALVGWENLGNAKYPMMDIMAWLEHAVADRGFTLESLAAVLVVFFLYSVLGRFFCGWVCPMDLIFAIFEKKLNTPREPPRIRFHKPTRDEKIVPIISILGFLALSYIFSMPFFTTMSPVAGTTKFGAMLVAIIANVPAATVGTTLAFLYTMIFALGVNIVAEKVFGIKRFWCKYICPIGNIYGLVMNKYSPMRLKVVNRDKCTKCNLCSMACPMSIDIVHYIEKGTDVMDHRCFHCGRCAEVCPYGVLDLGFRIEKE